MRIGGSLVSKLICRTPSSARGCVGIRDSWELNLLGPSVI